MNRRRFQLTVIGATGLVMAASFSLAAARYLLAVPRSQPGRQDGDPNEGEWIEAGDVGELRVGVPRRVVFERTRTDAWKTTREKGCAWVVKNRNGSVVAFSPLCTHLGCVYRWGEAERSFVCPCHASRFSADGAIVSGPAPRPLDRLQTRIENNTLWLGPLVKRG